MVMFLRIIKEKNKSNSLKDVCKSFRTSKTNSLLYKFDLKILDIIPGKPFTYWVSDKVLSSFKNLEIFANNHRYSRGGLQTNDNFRFLNL